MKIKLYATCVQYYTDEDGNEFIQFVTDLGQFVNVRKSYSTFKPCVGDRVIVEAKATLYTDKATQQPKAFLGYNCVAICKAS